MRRNVLVVLAVIAALGVGLSLLREDRGGGATAAAPAQPESAPRAAAAAGTPRPAAMQADARSAELAAPESATAATDSAPRGDPGANRGDAPRVTVQGRLLDSSDAPVAGARLRLLGYPVWAAGAEAAVFPGRYEYRGFEQLSGADGAFRFDVPVPTVEVTWLEVEPEPYLDSAQIHFGERRDARPPLTAGVRDLGDLVLAATGVIRGRVSDASGAPLADVHIGIGETRSSTLGRDTVTAADGSFLVAHAPVGTYGVRARHDEHLMEFVSPVTVAAGADTAPIDFALQPAPTLSGVVVDERGAPVAGARLEGWPTAGRGGRGVFGKSAEDGTFELFMPHEEPYTLAASHDDYEPAGDSHDRSTTYAPGTRGLRFVLRRGLVTTFVVVDDDSGEPVEEFGLRVLKGEGSKAARRSFSFPRPARLEAHPGGEVTAAAAEGVDAVEVATTGHLRHARDVAHDTPGVPRQVLRLRRAPVVRGSASSEGRPVSGAPVRLEPGSWRAESEAGGAGSFFPRDDGACDTTTDARGAFELAVTQLGTYRLSIAPNGVAPLVVVPLEVRADIDLGALHVLPGASVTGRVLVPPGVDPGGLTVHLGSIRSKRVTATRSDGTFSFEDVSAGSQLFTLGERAGVLEGGARTTVALAAGAAHEVVLDAREFGMCHVTLLVDLGGAATEGVLVTLAPAADPQAQLHLGALDTEGRVDGSVRAVGDAHVWVMLKESGRRLHPTARLSLVRGQPVEAAIGFEFVRLRCILPAGVEVPQAGSARLTLEPLDGGGTTTASLQLRDVSGGGGSEAALSFEHLLPGSYSATLSVTDASAPLQRVDLGDGSFRMERPARWSGTLPVVLGAWSDQELRF